MNLRYIPSSGLARAASVVLASLVTASLFGAVAIGLTGEGGSALLAQVPGALQAAAG